MMLLSFEEKIKNKNVTGVNTYLQRCCFDWQLAIP